MEKFASGWLFTMIAYLVCTQIRFPSETLRPPFLSLIGVITMESAVGVTEL